MIWNMKSYNMLVFSCLLVLVFDMNSALSTDYNHNAHTSQSLLDCKTRDTSNSPAPLDHHIQKRFIFGDYNEYEDEPVQSYDPFYAHQPHVPHIYFMPNPIKQQNKFAKNFKILKLQKVLFVLHQIKDYLLRKLASPVTSLPVMKFHEAMLFNVEQRIHMTVIHLKALI